MVLDAQRAQNINIMLAKFGKKSYFDLAQVGIAVLSAAGVVIIYSMCIIKFIFTYYYYHTIRY